MRLHHLALASAIATVLTAFVACGGRSQLDGYGHDGGADAPTDVKIKQDVSVPDVGPPPYVPLGKRCNASDAGAPLAWSPTADGGAPLHPPIMESSGGIVIGTPVFVPMTFNGDDLRDPIEDFIASVGCTTYWRSIVPDYGIGDGVTSPPVHMTEAPPTTIDDGAIAAFIRSKIVSQQAPAYVPGSTLYVIFYPDTTDITLQGEHSCKSFGGYHNDFGMPDGTRVPYAVIPRCNNFNGLGGIDMITAAGSHELVEAVSDPLPSSTPAFQFPEVNGVAWALVGGGEIGDLCEFNDDAFFLPSDYFFYVQRSWTSHAAFLAQDPCQPSSTVFIAAAPVLPDKVSFNFGSGNQQADGIAIGVGSNKTISLKLIASEAWPDSIDVEVRDYAQFFGGPQALSFDLPVTTGNVGDTLQLTVNRNGTNAQFGLEPFAIRVQSNGVRRTWWALVGDP